MCVMNEDEIRFHMDRDIHSMEQKKSIDIIPI